MITIYRFSLYDVRSDELVLSKRWGTLDAIAKIGGQIVESSAFETDEALVASDVVGLTEVGFAPPTAIVQTIVEVTIDAKSVVA